MLKGKKIILGITGSIAAYKAAFLTRLLIKEGAEVKVIMTPLALEFITPVTMATLSKHTVLTDFFNHDDGEWNSHVDLGIWADLMLIAPVTANTIAKMANGVCDNLLLTTYLSARCPVVVAPAMDLDMFSHPATIKNIETIKSYGNLIVEPSSGELASGLEGKGRMEEPENIVAYIADFFDSKKKKIAKTFLVTAGPTYENIDPVRFIGNYSSGKMGYALAETLANLGNEVILISGPTSLNIVHPNISLVRVNTSEEMFNETIHAFEKVDCAIMAAAVADYKPDKQAKEKLKKHGDKLELLLEPTKDILAELGRRKRNEQILVGFALETENEIENARKKLKKKNLDLIVLNSLKEEGAGFGHDTNKIKIIDKNNKIDNFELKSKKEVAIDIINKIVEII